MGHLNSFSAAGGGNLNRNFQKIQMPGGLPWGMFKLRFDWYISDRSELFSSFLQAVAKRTRSNNRMQITEFPARLCQHKLVQREIQEK